MTTEEEFKFKVEGMYVAHRDNAREHYKEYKDEPELGLKTLYKCVKITPSGQSGDKNYANHQFSLWGAFFAVIGYLGYTDKHEEWENAVEHLRKQYVDGQEHYSNEKFDFELNRFLSERFEDGEYIPPDDTERKSKKVDKDVKGLLRFPRMTMEEFLERQEGRHKGIENPHKLPVIQFLNEVWNPEVMTYKSRGNAKPRQGYFATGENQRYSAYIYNLSDYENIAHKLKNDIDYEAPPNTLPATFNPKLYGITPEVAENYKIINTHFFMSRGLFKTHGQDAGRRIKDECINPAFITFECDELSNNAQECFIYLMDMFATFAPLREVIDTGGKSFHFNFNMSGVDKDIVRGFTDIAIRYCADTGVANNSISWVRLPNTPPSAEGRRHQRLLYFCKYNAIPSNITEAWDILGLEDKLKKFSQRELYHHKDRFYKKGEGDREEQWIGLSRNAILNQLHLIGVRRTVNAELEDVSPADKLIAEIENKKTLASTQNRISGYKSGVHKDNNNDLTLVCNNIQSPNLIKGKCEGKFPTIDTHLHNLFNEDEYHIFMGKLAGDLRAYYNEGRDTADFTYQSLYVVIVGVNGNGKSLLATVILEKLFGKSCSAKYYLLGGQFTGEESECPLLTLDEVNLAESPTARKEFGVTIKDLNNGKMRIERKYADSITLPVFNVLLHLMNYEELGCLPDLNNRAVASKMIILDTKPYDQRNVKLQMPRSKAEQLVKEFEKEIDYFYTYLINEHEVPEEYRGDRFIVKSFISRGIEDRVDENSPTGFLQMIIEGNPIIYGNTLRVDDVTLETQRCWEGTANDLYANLQRNLDEGQKKIFNKYFYDMKVFTTEIKNVCRKNGSILYSNGFEAEMIQPLSPKKINGVYYYRACNIKEVSNDEEL